MANWAESYIRRLMSGEQQVSMWPVGNSMTPRIKSGQHVVVQKVDDQSSLRKGDIVLCRIGSRDYLHLVKSIRVTADGHPIFQIANNHGRINGWTRHVYGKVVKIG